MQWKCTTTMLQKARLCCARCSWLGGEAPGARLRARTKRLRLKPRAHRGQVAAPASQGLHMELPAGRERGDTGTCHIPSSLDATDGSSGGASAKPTQEALGSCCPGQPALLHFAGWKCWEEAAGIYKWLSSPEHSHGPVQVCSNHSAVLPSPLSSSSVHLLPACQGAQSSLPAVEQVQHGLAAASPAGTWVPAAGFGMGQILPATSRSPPHRAPRQQVDICSRPVPQTPCCLLQNPSWGASFHSN